jgi:hypothetical protein
MKNKKLYWTGLFISYILAFFFAFNVLVKLFPATFYPQIVEQMEGIGLHASILPIIATLEAICTIAYLIPATSVLGAVLFTGYLGGAILTHLRVDQPVYLQTTLGFLLWLGLYLREPRLHELLPIRRKSAVAKEKHS